MTCRFKEASGYTGAQFKRHNFDAAGVCKRCKKVRKEVEPLSSTTEIGGGMVGAEITREETRAKHN